MNIMPNLNIHQIPYLNRDFLKLEYVVNYVLYALSVVLVVISNTIILVSYTVAN